MKSTSIILTNNTINFSTSSTCEVVLYSANLSTGNKPADSTSVTPLFYKVWQKISRISIKYENRQVTACNEVRSLRCNSIRNSIFGSKQFLYTTLTRYSMNQLKGLNIVNTSELRRIFSSWGSLTAYNWTMGTLRAYRLLSFLFLNKIAYQFESSTPDVKTPLNQFPILKYL